MNVLARRVAALLSVAVLLLALAAVAHAARPSGTYAGNVKGTGLNQKLRFTVKGGKVRSTRARVTLTCNGPYSTITYRLRGTAAVKRGRSFRISKRARYKTKEGSAFTVKITVAGRFNRAGTRARGTVRGSGTVVEPPTPLVGGLAEPGETAKCSSPPGKQRFLVRRKRR